jgi:CheY-like chemotaxis protein/KaiC/GvpD/RAD55 family RecA-like ATPase
MQSESGNTIISGIEPVDELMGGLERGQLYLVHGEASGKSLFGIKFLIEGLRRGENGALVIRYSPEDAVRRFAQLGYDCLEDVYSGRLVILEYSDDIIQKIGKLRALTPVLRELEWLLGETRPERLIFDPIASVLAGSEGNFDTRAREFAEWARSFAATVVLIANESNHEIIKSFEPLVAESFRFDVRDLGDRAARFIAFEKSSVIPDQAIEVDPSRGLFLLGRAYSTELPGSHQAAPQPPSIAELESIREELRAARAETRAKEREPIVDVDLMGDDSISPDRTSGTEDAASLVSPEPKDARRTRKLTPLEEKEFQSPRANTSQPAESTSREEVDFQLDVTIGPSTPGVPQSEGQLDELSYLLDDLTSSASPLDLDLPELSFLGSATDPGFDRSDSESGGPVQTAFASAESQQPSVIHHEAGTTSGGDGEQVQARSTRHSRASDLKIDSAMAARAVELLLHPPESDIDFPSSVSPTTRRRSVRDTAQPESPTETEVRAKDFNVLIIEDDPETCDLLTQTLGDYSLEVVHDGVSGLAKLISFKPDLVVLDFDLPVIDGFKVLTLIRSALNVPIIIVSGSRMRAIDRVMASELGADYYLTKPFSAKELKHKARQLIARYRGLSSWIMNPSSVSSEVAEPGHVEPPAGPSEPPQELFTPYSEFAEEVDKRVKAAMDNGAPFSIVGCRLPQMTADGGRRALKLFEIVRGLTRDSDLTTTNPRNDLVIMLADAGAAGARAFAGRLRARVAEELQQEAALWMRSFPDLEESTEVATPVDTTVPGSTFNRRSSDPSHDQPSPALTLKDEQSIRKADPRASYIEFLEHL